MDEPGAPNFDTGDGSGLPDPTNGGNGDGGAGGKPKKGKKKRKAPADGTRALRSTETAIEMRRASVFEMYFQRKMPIGEISESLGVHRDTVGEDIKWLRLVSSQAVRSHDVIEAVGITKQNYQLAAALAMREFQASTSRRTKNLLLQTYIKALNSLAAFEMGIGTLPSRKVPIDLKIHGQVDVNHINGDERLASVIKDPQKRRRVVQFLEKTINFGSKVDFSTFGVPIPTLGDSKLIDADAKVIDVTPVTPSKPPETPPTTSPAKT